MASVMVQGQQGPPGPQGLQGIPGYAKRFGTVDYTDNDAGTPLALPAGVWMRLIRNLTPSPANFNLPSGPFEGFAFWDNAAGLLRARARGDALLMKFTFTVVPDQQAGGLRFAVRPGDDPAFDFGPEPIVLTTDAGEAQTGSETFFVQCRPRFVDQGAQIYIMATTGGTLMQFSPEITPLDFAV
ncbi:hypothetical protein Q8W71_13870 [Methylobacterium sp. NEAU 140]|uniref:hypothetical protein n=1 Tax=Methylobacterium sp. NEAU 140 TaxID=3064945 RepID=UPI002732E43F|nr:hypothetical protein [Methylobacterium sp. NEAU 140]MDP4023719.1 hypothetical protein [Methylobacterium sp. NEAU 140]